MQMLDSKGGGAGGYGGDGDRELAGARAGGGAMPGHDDAESSIDDEIPF